MYSTLSNHYYSLLLTITHYYPLLPTTTHYYPLLLTTTHYYPLLPTTTHYYSLLLTTTHQRLCVPTTYKCNYQQFKYIQMEIGFRRKPYDDVVSVETQKHYWTHTYKPISTLRNLYLISLPYIRWSDDFLKKITQLRNMGLYNFLKYMHHLAYLNGCEVAI